MSKDLNNTKEPAKKEFDAGEKIGFQFNKKMVISQHPTILKRYNAETERYEPILNDEGNEIEVMQSRIKLPASSQYKGFLFETTNYLFEPHRFVDGEALGANSKMWMVKVFENARYDIKRTPYLEPDEEGNRKLDFANQEVVKLTGKELRAEMHSWMNKNRSNPPSEIEKLKELKKEPQATFDNDYGREDVLDITSDDLPF